MLFRKHIVSTRTLFQLTVVTVFSLVGAGVARAANSGNPPLLVPYTIETAAGTPQYPTAGTAVLAGYGGDGGPAVPYLGPKGVVAGPSLNAPYGVAVDSVGNIYITDTNNDIIREVNAQTGVINTIAGVLPRGCSGTTCSLHTSGCADGVPALGAPIGGKLEGIAVDAYGNVYFVDNNSNSVSVIYRGGARVAAFIALEDPGAAPTASAVQLGYIYHIAGATSLTSCAATVGATDNGLAFTNTAVPNSTPTATLHNPALISLDSAGNIYIADVSNLTVRVINTQATPQTFFQYTVQPGYMRSITNCNAALTITCPTITTSQYGTGINGPVNAIVYNSQYTTGLADAYGNIYQLNGTGGGTGAPGIYAATTYAGGAPLTNLLTAETPLLAQSYGPNPSGFTFPAGVTPTAPELPLTYGNSYDSINNEALGGSLPNNYANIIAVQPGSLDVRPSSMLPDVFGTIWFLDHHYPELERIDQYTADSTGIIGSAHQRATASIAGIESSPASLTNPWYCVYGSAANPWTQGPQETDPEGDGCPAILAQINNGEYNTVADGLGNVYMGDNGQQLIRELPLGNTFPATAVGTATPVIQPIQVHFDQSNIPLIGGQVPDAGNIGYTTTSFSIMSGGGDFTINTTTPEFPMGAVINGSASTYGQNATTANFQMWSGLPTCTQLGLTSPDNSYDCLVYVQFNPTAPGLRQGILQAKTANGSIYNFQLTGIGNGGALAIDGGQQQAIAATGLGTTAQVAVTQTGTLYIADPTNNRVVVLPSGAGTQTTIGTGLKGPMGVAVDAAGNVYISDTGNNRVLKVNPNTGAQTVLGNYLWIPGATCDGGTTPLAGDCPVPAAAGSTWASYASLAAEPGASVTPTTAPPQYQFNGPQGLAVDTMGNVYVADTGNAAVVEITSNTALGGAVPLLSYPGAPKFVTPVSVAVDSHGYVYVADQGNPSGEVVRIPPGGGDLQPSGGNPGSALSLTTLPLFGGQGINMPNGVAVDAAGNVYISDASGNAVWEAPAVGPPNGNPFILNFSGLSSPGGLALDVSGNLYVSDSANKRVLFENRQNPLISFGTVPQDLSNAAQPICANTQIVDGLNVGNSGACVLTVSNIGNQAVTLTSPFLTITNGNAAFGVTHTCTSSPLLPGTTCSVSPTFTPNSDGAQSEGIGVNGTQSMALVATTNATGANPLVKIVLASSVGTSPAAGSNAVLTATVTQPFVQGVTPSGTVTFTVAIDSGTYEAATINGVANSKSCGATLTMTEPLVNGVATYPYPSALAAGLVYTVTANYNGDTQDSPTQSGALVLTVPGIAESVTAASASYTYGSAVPTITGTLSPIPPTGVTYTFTSGASQYSNIGSYPIQVQFSGTGACAYGFPAAQTTGGTAATITENPATLTVSFPQPFSTVYGAPPYNFALGMQIVGAVGTDLQKLSATFTPLDSSILDVGSYTVIPTMTGKPIGNYIVKITNGVDNVTAAPSAISVTAAATAELPTKVTSGTYTLSVASLVTQGKGTPSGTVTVYDNFVPITPTVFYPVPSPANVPPAAASSVIPPCTGTLTPPACNTPIVVTLTAGLGTFNLPAAETQLGTHYFSFQYSGDPTGVGDGKGDFQCSVVGGAAVGSCASTGTAQTPLTVDNPDFTLTSTTGPINISPGVPPSGNGLPPVPNQNSAIPESAPIQINSVLSFAGNISLTCQTQNAYVTCFMTPTIACFATTATSTCPNTTTGTVILAVQTPATLPLGYNFGTGTAQVRPSMTKTVLAFLPFGVLAFCVRRRRRLSKALWVLIAIVAVSAGVTGCGGNLVDFYTPIPTGPQIVTVTASSTASGGVARSFLVPININ